LVSFVGLLLLYGFAAVIVLLLDNSMCLIKLFHSYKISLLHKNKTQDSSNTAPTTTGWNNSSNTKVCASGPTKNTLS
jgi:hypothetical protein